MKKRRYARFQSRIISWLLAVGLVLTGMPGGIPASLSGTVYAAEAERTEFSGQKENSAGEDATASDATTGDITTGDTTTGDATTGDTTTGDVTPEDYTGYYGYLPIPGHQKPEKVKVSVNRVHVQSVTQSKYVPTDDILPLTRSQNPYGTCWTFSTMATLEASAIKAGVETPSTVDLSEWHIAYFSYKADAVDPLGGLDGDHNRIADGYDYLDTGGNVGLAGNLLVSWVGAVDESLAPYSTIQNDQKNARKYTLDPEIGMEDRVHVQGFYEFDLQENPDVAKNMILEHGAISSAYYDATAYYNQANNAYYCSDQDTADHAIAIVGWDDNFDKNKFNTVPEGNGAWLIRNSWTAGKNTSDRNRQTYFWLSYYDTSLDSAYAFDVESADNYDNNYQYDGTMCTSTLAISSTMQAANVFTAHASEKGEILRAVGVNFQSANVNYIIKIYKNPTDAAKPTTGTLLETVTGQTECQGFYTIPLDEPLELAYGDQFAVVVSSTDESFRIAADYKMDSWCVTEASAEAGQSVYSSGTWWFDLGQKYGTNFRIKAYTDNITEPEKRVVLSGKNQIEVGESTIFTVTCTPEKLATDNEVIWSSTNEAILTVTDGVVTGIKPGKASVKVQVGDVSDEMEVEVVFSEFGVPSIVRNQERVSLQWDGLLGADRYDVYRTNYNNKNPQPTLVKSVQVSEERKYQDSDTVYGTKYGYYVRAVSLSPDENSKIVEITTDSPENTIQMPYQITYHLNDGSFNSTEIPSLYEEGESFALPIPVRTGYLFNGWYEDAKFKKAITGVSGDTHRNLDVYAKWSAEKYVVTFDANVPEGTKVTGKVAAQKMTYAVTAALNKNNYKCKDYAFMGWSTVPGMNQTVVYTDRQKVTFTENTTLYAVWKKTFDVTYISDGTTIRQDTRDYNKKYTLYKPQKTGYTFAGWFTDDGTYKKKVASVSSTAKTDYVLYAKWTENTYNIAFSGNGGSGSTKKVTLKYTDLSKTLTKSAFLKKGYAFTEWNTVKAPTEENPGFIMHEEETIDLVYLAEKGLLPAKNKGTLTLYAQWEWTPYTIGYQLNGGALKTAPVDSYEYKTVVELPVPVRENFTFGGWYTDANFKKPLKKITKSTYGNLTLYAKWNAEYTVIFHGGEDVKGKMADQKLKYQTSSALRANAYKKQGYQFVGWALSSEGAANGVITYKNKDKLLRPDVMQRENIEGQTESRWVIHLYAVWK